MNTQAVFCLDANVFIAAWYQLYPPDLFPDTWKSLVANKGQLAIPKTIFNEIEPYAETDSTLVPHKKKKKYPLKHWLEKNEFKPQPESNKVDEMALTLEKEYQTKKIGKGANKNDIRLIAFAKENNYKVVTLEAEQPQHPKEISKYKIPLICTKEKVTCIDFIELLRQLKTQCHEP